MSLSLSDIAYLKSATLLGKLPAASGFDELADDASASTFLEVGEILFKAGESLPGMYMVVHGAVELVLTDPLGNEKILEFVKSGNLVCEEGLFSGMERPYGARALIPTTILRLPEDKVSAWIVRYPEFGRHLLAIINDRIQYFSRDIYTQCTKTATARLVCYLLCGFEQAPHTEDGSYLLKVPMARKKLAARLGITGEHLSRAFRELREKGLIVSHPDGYHIPDVQRLSAYVCPAGCDW